MFTQKGWHTKIKEPNQRKPTAQVCKGLVVTLQRGLFVVQQSQRLPTRGIPVMTTTARLAK